MLKHFLQNDERFYQLTDHRPEDLDIVSWNNLQNKVRSLTGRRVGNWKDSEISKLVKKLMSDEYAELRSELLEGFDQYYRVIAESIVNEVCSESTLIEVDLQNELVLFNLLFLAENDYGDEPVRSDLYCSKEGILVVLKLSKNVLHSFTMNDVENCDLCIDSKSISHQTETSYVKRQSRALKNGHCIY